MKNNQPWTDQAILNPPKQQPCTSWWATPAAQTDRRTFAELAEQRRPSMRAAKDMVGPKVPV